MNSVKTCFSCGKTTRKTAIQLIRDCEQWWYFSNYKTKQGNLYSGTHCPECSDKVYAENSPK